MDIVNAHSSTDYIYKLNALTFFKQTVSVEAPEFCDDMQKVSFLIWRLRWPLMLGSFYSSNPRPPTCLCVQDAHEFLTTVLYQIRKLSPLLEQIAASKGKRYTCPVEEHLLFKMQTIRTCRRSVDFILCQSVLGSSLVLIQCLSVVWSDLTLTLTAALFSLFYTISVCRCFKPCAYSLVLCKQGYGISNLLIPKAQNTSPPPNSVIYLRK